MSEVSHHFALTVKIGAGNRVVVTTEDEAGEVELDADRVFSQLLARFPDTETVTLKVGDFYQDRLVYDVYGLTLAVDGHHVAAHWEPTESETGCEGRFVKLADGGWPDIVIGAVPRGEHATPVPFDSRSTTARGVSAPGTAGDPTEGQDAPR